MRVTSLKDAELRPRRIAVGEFDGVHLGHREVIRGNDTVLTFEPHPLRIVRPEAAPKLLTNLTTKADLIAELGVQELVLIPFDEGFAAQTPQEFVDEVLVSRLQATSVSVGENFRFGHSAAGDPTMLAADPRFDTTVVALVEGEGEIISSSHIRGLVLAGEVEEAGRLLGGRSRSAERSSRAIGVVGSSASRPPISSPTRSSCAPATGCMRPGPTASAPPSTSACGRRSERVAPC